MPGDPISALYTEGTASYVQDSSQRDALRAYYGLDEPLGAQYVGYLADLVQGDLGTSIRYQVPVSEVIAERLPRSLLLMGTALLLGTGLGVLAGAAAGWRRGQRLDRGLLTAMIGLRNFPVFFLGSIALFVFSVKLGWFPLSGSSTPFTSLPPLARAGDVAHHLALPAAVLATEFATGQFLLMRAGMVSELGSDYLLAGRAKGLRDRVLKYRYAGRNALLPVASLMAIHVSAMVTFTILVETVFRYEYFAEHADEISPQVIIVPVPDIEEVRATDRLTVEFRLSNPVATFLQFGGAGAVPIVPRHIWSEIDDPARVSDLEVLVGSGPYRLEAYEPGQSSYLYTAFDEHFLGRPVVRRIEYRPVDDELSALMAGTVDQASQPGLRPPALEPFRQRSELEVIEAPQGNNGFGLYWNLAEGGALADVRFRRACALAIDRQEMVARLFGGNATVGNPGWIPATNPFHVDVEQYPYDLAAANRLLDEAGYERSGSEGLRSDPDGEALSFSLLVNNERPMPAVELIVADLRELGVELTPEALDPPTFNERVIMGESEMSVIRGAVKERGTKCQVADGVAISRSDAEGGGRSWGGQRRTRSRSAARCGRACRLGRVRRTSPGRSSPGAR